MDGVGIHPSGGNEGKLGELSQYYRVSYNVQTKYIRWCPNSRLQPETCVALVRVARKDVTEYLLVHTVLDIRLKLYTVHASRCNATEFYAAKFQPAITHADIHLSSPLSASC